MVSDSQNTAIGLIVRGLKAAQLGIHPSLLGSTAEMILFTLGDAEGRQSVRAYLDELDAAEKAERSKKTKPTGEP
jgi:hypothetical protein